MPNDPLNMDEIAQIEMMRISRVRIDVLTKEKDQAYSERNRLVAALSKLFPSHLSRHPESEVWDNDWRWIVCIHIPTDSDWDGHPNMAILERQQVSWHIHDSELHMFNHLGYYDATKLRDSCKYDGHTTEEKYMRLEKIYARG